VTVRRLEMPQPTERLAYGISGDPAQTRTRFPGGGLTLLVPLALLALLVPVHYSWAAQFLLILLLLTIPGVILLRALRIPGSVVASFPVYVPCASLVVLLGSGLAVDLAGPVVGIVAPLRPWPMLAGLELVCLILLAISINAPSNVASPATGGGGRGAPAQQ
jgi:hypothetical protein